MSDDWLDELDVNAIPDDEFTLPRNTYLCRTLDFKPAAAQTKNPGLAYFIINWQIDEGEYESYNRFGQWVALPPIYAGEKEDGSGDPMVNSKEDVSDFSPSTNRDHNVIIIRLKKVITALGYGADEIKGILRRIVKDNDFSWIEDRRALIDCSSYKDDKGYSQVRVHGISVFEGKPKPSADILSDDNVPF